MRDCLPHVWLNNAELERRGGTFEGIVTAVAREEVRNKFKYELKKDAKGVTRKVPMRELVPVIRFNEGVCLVPNTTMRRALIETLGPDTDRWIGKRLKVFLQRVQREDDDGTLVTRTEKVVMMPDAERAWRPTVVKVQSRAVADYDDSVAAGE